MKIISKFQDYYDRALSFGADTELTYVRQTQEYERQWVKGKYEGMPEYLHSFLSIGTSGQGPFEEARLRGGLITFHVVVVAGVAHFGIQAQPSSIFRPPEEPLVSWLWTPEAFFNWLSRQPEPRSRKGEIQVSKERREVRLAEGTAEFFQPRKFSWIEDICIEHKLPLVHATSGRVVVNPCLRPLEFIKCMEPFTIYQELSMFLGNLASKDDTPVKIADKDRVQQHGFDKWSFRKKGVNSID